MIIESQLVTPEQAREWIARHEEVAADPSHPITQRKVKRSRVALYRKHMDDGVWFPPVNNGIHILPSGFVMNGQHTLHAISGAKGPVEVFVIDDADIRWNNYYDDGANRTGTDLKVMEKDAKYAVDRQAAARLLYAYHENNMGWVGRSPLNKHEVNAFEKEHPGIKERMPQAFDLSREPGIPRRISAAMLYEADPDNEHAEVIAEWIEGLHTQVGLVENDPRTALIRWMRRRTGTNRSPLADLIAYIKCWNAWVQGKEMRSVTVTAKDVIPTILQASEKV